MNPSDKIVARIVKLFKLGSAAANTTEAETLAAITKAKALMAEHAISEYTVQAALDAAADRAGAARVRVDTYTAYTRKIRNLARYDGIVALCVGTLTQTEPYLGHTDTLDGHYVSMKFVGTEADAAVASALFLIFLPEVRRAARTMYGSAKWDKRHTSYAIGYATRMLDRARESVRDLTPQQASTMALIVRDKTTAIQSYMQGLNLKKGQSDKKLKIDAWAYTRGYADGAHAKMDPRIIEKGKAS